MLTTHAERPVGKIFLAFAIIYFVWGSTFFAIRVGVHAMPPLTMAALRFVISGIVLVAWQISRGEKLPVRREWAAATFLGFLIFVCDYGLLFWAEQTVPSGVAAVVLATIPVFMAVFEVLFLRTQQFTVRLVFALLVGIVGVVALVSKTLNLGGAPIDRIGTMALIFAAMTWSISSVITRKLPLPASKAMSSGVQMLAGGVLLIPAAGIFGEFSRFHPATVSFGAWMALLYLIVFGSIIGFTAYVWLLHHESPTKVGTYAYVNPVIAVIVGYFLGGEAVGARTLIGTACVLVSVVVITSARAAKPAPQVQPELAERR
jgi:drug/metabolite transporter (DMT)-like permease